MSDNTQPIVRRALAATLIATPILWLAAEVISPPLKSSTTDQLTEVAAHAGRWSWFTLTLVVGMLLFVPAVLGLMRLARPAAPKLTAWGGTLVLYGTVIGASDAMGQFVVREMVARTADRAQMVALFDRAENSTWSGLFFASGGISFLIGSVLLAVALWRSHALAPWVAVLFGGGLVANLVGWSSNSIAVIAGSALVLLVAGVPAAAAVASADAAEPRVTRHRSGDDLAVR